MEHTVIHDEKVDRFEVFESGQIAYLQYDEKNGVLVWRRHWGCGSC